ncbi:MAG: GAF and ANTAR domain-containing protein, partial [Actinomycetes bacterium]
RTGKPVTVEDLRVDGHRWPHFTTRAVEYGLVFVQAFPLRLRTDRLGALNLLRRTAGRLDDADLAIGQALADVATIGILHQRVATRLDLLNQQLQSALDTRMVIEQAKGILAARGGIGVDPAFHLLRTHARVTGTRLVDAAHSVVEGGDTTAILAGG